MYLLKDLSMTGTSFGFKITFKFLFLQSFSCTCLLMWALPQAFLENDLQQDIPHFSFSFLIAKVIRMTHMFLKADLHLIILLIGGQIACTALVQDWVYVTESISHVRFLLDKSWCILSGPSLHLLSRVTCKQRLFMQQMRQHDLLVLFELKTHKHC